MSTPTTVFREELPDGFGFWVATTDVDGRSIGLGDVQFDAFVGVDDHASRAVVDFEGHGDRSAGDGFPVAAVVVVLVFLDLVRRTEGTPVGEGRVHRFLVRSGRSGDLGSSGGHRSDRFSRGVFDQSPRAVLPETGVEEHPTDGEQDRGNQRVLDEGEHGDRRIEVERDRSHRATKTLGVSRENSFSAPAGRRSRWGGASDHAPS